MAPELELLPQTIQRYETEYTPESSWDPFILLALADVYGVRPSSISTVVAGKLNKVRDLLTRTSPCINSRAGHRTPVAA